MPAEALVLDANLLVLLIVGTTSEAYISRHKRLRRNVCMVGGDRHGGRRPAIHGSRYRSWKRRGWRACARHDDERSADSVKRFVYFAVFRGLLRKLREIYVPSLHASEQKAFLRLGVTDAGLLLGDFADHVLMTVDLDLYLEAGRLKRKAINFNHYIEANRTIG